MRIGLDFDNTIACYDDAFSFEAKRRSLVDKNWAGSKQDLKFLLGQSKTNEVLWQQIQGQVYGPLINKARLFPGIARFLFRSKLNGYKVFIVSHKTKFGHFDNSKTLLREVALDWMDNQGFFSKEHYGIERKNVFFADTQSDKINKIKNLNLDLFVDDLEEILSNKEFPEIKKILFGSSLNKLNDIYECKSWSEIENISFPEITDHELKKIVNSFFKKSIQDVKKIKGRGNSRVYKLIININNYAILKDYPNLSIDSRPRLITETQALKELEIINKTPKVLKYNIEHNLALLDWVDGNNDFKVEDNHIDQALVFIKSIQHFLKIESWELASEACLMRKNIVDQINFRLEKLLKIRDNELNNFIDKTLKPLLDRVLKFSFNNWPDDNLDIKLPISNQILSPSDFGFHNSILSDSGELKFIDFEYFGRDDPVKLISDFIWHPGMNLNYAQKKQWINGSLKLFSSDPEISKRLNASWSLYGIRWALIVLNDFHRDGWNKRSFVDKHLNLERESRLLIQLNKSKDICNRIQMANIKCPYV